VDHQNVWPTVQAPVKVANFDRPGLDIAHYMRFELTTSSDPTHYERTTWAAGIDMNPVTPTVGIYYMITRMVGHSRLQSIVSVHNGTVRSRQPQCLPVAFPLPV